MKKVDAIFFGGLFTFTPVKLPIFFSSHLIGVIGSIYHQKIRVPILKWRYDKVPYNIYKALSGVGLPLHKPYPYSLHRSKILHFRYYWNVWWQRVWWVVSSTSNQPNPSFLAGLAYIYYIWKWLITNQLLYEWPYKWLTGVITPLSGVVAVPITGRGPPCTPWEIMNVAALKNLATEKTPCNRVRPWLDAMHLIGSGRIVQSSIYIWKLLTTSLNIKFSNCKCLAMHRNANKDKSHPFPKLVFQR